MLSHGDRTTARDGMAPRCDEKGKPSHLTSPAVWHIAVALETYGWYVAALAARSEFGMQTWRDDSI